METTSGSTGRRRRNSLSRDEIVAAAFELFEEGAADVSLRSVATRIGASPMGLYAHIATKADLLDAVADRVLDELPGPDDGTRDWIDAGVDRAAAHLAVLTAHPWAVPVLLARPNPGPAAAIAGEHYLRTFARGLDPDAAAVAFTATLAVVYGTAAFTTAAGRSADAQERDAVVERIRGVEGLPHTAAATGTLADYGSEAQFRRSVRALLTGLAVSRRSPV
ncbi:MAG TPA: helix-turn-helix domain-containing protein [Agromyces mariniharenae]|nr:helix-turn-helix domain-containing protein [Agromyces mariniharenae]